MKQLISICIHNYNDRIYRSRTYRSRTYRSPYATAGH
jgi:hypothetical protein